MGATLYDLLEISQTAGDEAIEAAFRRMLGKYTTLAGNGDEDAVNRMIAVREAHKTLMNPESRRRYDQRLSQRSSEWAVEEKPPFPWIKALLLVAVIAFSGLGYAKYNATQEKARLAKEQAEAEARTAELAAAQKAEDKREAERLEAKMRQDEAQERYARAQDEAYARRVTRDNQIAESRYKYEQERAERERQNAERQQQYEAQRQLERDKATLRRLEAENSRFRF